MLLIYKILGIYWLKLKAYKIFILILKPNGLFIISILHKQVASLRKFQ